MTLTAYNRLPIPSFMYGTAWKKEATTHLVQLQVRQSFDSSLTHLHTEYVDSYVLHGPYSRWGLGKADWEVWTAMEDLYQSGCSR